MVSYSLNNYTSRTTWLFWFHLNLAQKYLYAQCIMHKGVYCLSIYTVCLWNQGVQLQDKVIFYLRIKNTYSIYTLYADPYEASITG